MNFERHDLEIVPFFIYTYAKTWELRPALLVWSRIQAGAVPQAQAIAATAVPAPAAAGAHAYPHPARAAAVRVRAAAPAITCFRYFINVAPFKFPFG